MLVGLAEHAILERSKFLSLSELPELVQLDSSEQSKSRPGHSILLLHDRFDGNRPKRVLVQVIGE